jgi:hypothetical protein
MALKGQTIEDIVGEHPMALLQCMDFKKYPKKVEDKDTARNSSRRIQEKN